MICEFDILEYMSGLTSYTFDESVLKRIALDRGVLEVSHHSMLDEQTKDLLLADLLFTVYIGANSTASYSVSDGSFRESIGSQTINSKREIYSTICGIYSSYGEFSKLSRIENQAGNTLTWINENEWE